jgi:predicted RNA-binding Zn ribbon-like protein
MTFLGLLNKARHDLALTKARATADFVTDCVDAGQKVVVFTAYTGVVDTLLERFGPTAVRITGTDSAEAREQAVQRFQNDDAVRVFVGNIHAAGTGITLTAASHVVFNDLDWVPANHWQAEDRAYRIGQTGTVNVHYQVASGTIDEFVQGVLETKTALISAVVDGEALSPDATRDVLSELEALVSKISANISDPDTPMTDEEWVEALLNEVEHENAASQTSGGEAKKPVLSRDALLALARVLTRPTANVYRMASKSDPSKSYTLTCDAGDVTCTCPGFEYRGMCSHSKTLKAALAAGKPVPAEYEKVGG